MGTEEMREVLRWVRIVFIVLAVFLVSETVGVLKSLRNIDPVYNSISVIGEGEVISAPDVATFSFVVSADDKDVSSAQSQVTDRMDKILASLKSVGVDKKDIKTTDYSVYPKYTYTPAVCVSYCPPSKQILDGYTVSHNISVKIRKTEKVGEILSLVGENGATNISGISFTTDDPDQAIKEARAEAIKDAKDKAEILADELGVRLVRVTGFYDNTRPAPYYAEAIGGEFVKSNGVIPNIPVGENKVQASVTVTYEIR